MRETLFNWLQADISGARCLDLFAGSGALGLEALSRGASFLCAVERHRSVAQRLRENIVLLGEQDRAEVLQQDVGRVLRDVPATPFNIVFADPPFAAALLPEVCDGLLRNSWVAADAVVYLEQDAKRPWPQPPVGWTVAREGLAGQSAQRLLRCSITR